MKKILHDGVRKKKVLIPIFDLILKYEKYGIAKYELMYDLR
jgi:hypothetical protein